MVNFSRRFQNKPPFFGVRPKAGLTRENEMLLYLIIFAFFWSQQHYCTFFSYFFLALVVEPICQLKSLTNLKQVVVIWNMYIIFFCCSLLYFRPVPSIIFVSFFFLWNDVNIFIISQIYQSFFCLQPKSQQLVEPAQIG